MITSYWPAALVSAVCAAIAIAAYFIKTRAAPRCRATCAQRGALAAFWAAVGYYILYNLVENPHDPTTIVAAALWCFELWMLGRARPAPAAAQAFFRLVLILCLACNFARTGDLSDLAPIAAVVVILQYNCLVRPPPATNGPQSAPPAAHAPARRE